MEPVSIGISVIISTVLENFIKKISLKHLIVSTFLFLGIAGLSLQALVYSLPFFSSYLISPPIEIILDESSNLLLAGILMLSFDVVISERFEELEFRLLIRQLKSSNSDTSTLALKQIFDSNKNASTLRKADLRGIRISGAELSEINFFQSDLSSASFVNCRMTAANFSQVKARETNFSGSYLDFSNMEESLFVNTNFSNSVLDEANLSRSQFIHANLSNVSASGANLAKASFIDVNFKNANLTGANLTDAELINVNLENVLFDSTTIWPVGFIAPQNKEK